MRLSNNPVILRCRIGLGIEPRQSDGSASTSAYDPKRTSPISFAGSRSHCRRKALRINSAALAVNAFIVPVHRSSERTVVVTGSSRANAERTTSRQCRKCTRFTFCAAARVAPGVGLKDIRVPRGSKAMIDAAGARARLNEVRPGAWLISPYTGWKWARWPSGDVGWLPSDVKLPPCLRVPARNDIQ